MTGPNAGGLHASSILDVFEQQNFSTESAQVSDSEANGALPQYCEFEVSECVVP